MCPQIQIAGGIERNAYEAQPNSTAFVDELDQQPKHIRRKQLAFLPFLTFARIASTGVISASTNDAED